MSSSLVTGNHSDCPVPGNLPDETECVDMGKCRNGVCVPFCEALHNLDSCACNGKEAAVWPCGIVAIQTMWDLFIRTLVHVYLLSRCGFDQSNLHFSVCYHSEIVYQSWGWTYYKKEDWESLAARLLLSQLVIPSKSNGKHSVMTGVCYQSVHSVLSTVFWWCW